VDAVLRGPVSRLHLKKTGGNGNRNRMRPDAVRGRSANCGVSEIRGCIDQLIYPLSTTKWKNAQNRYAALRCRSTSDARNRALPAVHCVGSFAVELHRPSLACCSHGPIGPRAWPHRAHGSVGWCRLAAAARSFWCLPPHPPLVVPPGVLVFGPCHYGVIRYSFAPLLFGIRGVSGVSRRSFVRCGSSTIFQPSG
jgi:hypothetical protein